MPTELTLRQDFDKTFRDPVLLDFFGAELANFFQNPQYTLHEKMKALQEILEAANMPAIGRA